MESPFKNDKMKELIQQISCSCIFKKNTSYNSSEPKH